MYCGFCFDIILPSVEIVIASAQIAERTVGPVTLVVDLQLQINNLFVIDDYL